MLVALSCAAIFLHSIFINSGYGALEGINYQWIETFGTSLGIFYGNLIVVSFFVIGRWFYVAAKINHLSGIEGLKIKPGWAVGWYVIPIANFFMPYLSLKETYKASFGGLDWSQLRTSWYLPLWWVTWLAFILVMPRLESAFSSSWTLPETHAFGIAHDGAMIVNAFALLKIISVIAYNQEDKILQNVNVATYHYNTSGHRFIERIWGIIVVGYWVLTVLVGFAVLIFKSQAIMELMGGVWWAVIHVLFLPLVPIIGVFAISIVHGWEMALSVVAVSLLIMLPYFIYSYSDDWH